MKKIIFAILTMFSLNAFAISIPVTESMVNSQVSVFFPKTVKKMELSNPKITLLEGKSVLCMDGVPKIILLDMPFKFCASFKPIWNEKESKLEATNLELMNLDINGVWNVSPVLRLALNEVLTGMEPLVLYKSDSWLLKQISDIEIKKAIIYLKF